MGTLKEIINEGVEITGTKNIADKFNEYFTEIGSKLAKSINRDSKAQFNCYLTTPCGASSNFAYTNPDNIEKITRNLRPRESSAGSENISDNLESNYGGNSVLALECVCYKNIERQTAYTIVTWPILQMNCGQKVFIHGAHHVAPYMS